ncbi:Component of the BRCA1-A complex [Allomyces arbusculus]|nr:Component of the BRCA1-A complex [Allomyces arbusculus]
MSSLPRPASRDLLPALSASGHDPGTTAIAQLMVIEDDDQPLSSPATLRRTDAPAPRVLAPIASVPSRSSTTGPPPLSIQTAANNTPSSAAVHASAAAAAATSPFTQTRAQTPTERFFASLTSLKQASSLLLASAPSIASTSGGAGAGSGVGIASTTAAAPPLAMPAPSLANAMARFSLMGSSASLTGVPPPGSTVGNGAGSAVGGMAAVPPRKVAPNLDENILFCLDLHEENALPLSPLEINSRSRLDETKDLLKRFIFLKHQLKPSHQFGLITLENVAKVYMVPTADLEFLNLAIDGIATTGAYLQCDLESLFNVVEETLHVTADADQVYRVILIYSRTNVFPDSRSNKVLKRLYDTGRFFFDVVYVHEPPNDANFPQEIYDAFATFRDTRGIATNWSFQVCRSWKTLATVMTQLLSHPLQRAPQSEPT